MHKLDELKNNLMKELEILAMNDQISTSSLEKIHKLTDTIKNIEKIEMLSEDMGDYSQRRYSRMASYDDDVSYERGRGSNAKRDSMGRYSSDGDYSERDRRYSRGDAKEHIMDKLGEAMRDADPNEREILKHAMRKLEQI